MDNETMRLGLDDVEGFNFFVGDTSLLDEGKGTGFLPKRPWEQNELLPLLEALRKHCRYHYRSCRRPEANEDL